MPELVSCRSSRRAWQLRAARPSQGRGKATGRPATASGARARLDASKVADFTAFDTAGTDAADASKKQMEDTVAAAKEKAAQHGQSALLGSASARTLRLLRARLAAPGSSVLP